MSKSSIWLIDRNLSGGITTGQSAPGSDDNKEVRQIPQSSMSGDSQSYSLISYSEHSLRESYPSV